MLVKSFREVCIYICEGYQIFKFDYTLKRKLNIKIENSVLC